MQSPGPVTPRLRLRHPALRVGLDLLVNIGLPLVIYLLARARFGTVPALLASSGPPILWSLVEFIRVRRLDALSVMVLAGIVLSLLAFLGGGSVRALELRENFATLAIGLAFLGSVAIGRPLVYYLALAGESRKSAAARAAFEAKCAHPGLRRMMSVMTLVWGAGLVASFAISVGLVYLLPIEEYLVIGPVVGYATLAVLGLWTFRYARAAGKHATVPAATVAAAGPDNRRR